LPLRMIKGKVPIPGKSRLYLALRIKENLAFLKMEKGNGGDGQEFK